MNAHSDTALTQFPPDIQLRENPLKLQSATGSDKIYGSDINTGLFKRAWDLSNAATFPSPSDGCNLMNPTRAGCVYAQML
eukprot:2511816-Pyramimonas_sp.AAC.1